MEKFVKILRLTIGKFNISFEHESPKDFLVSQWQSKDKCVGYVIYRWIIASFFIFSVATSIIYALLRNQLLVYLIYLTNWNLNFTMVMTCMSAWMATMYYKDKYDIKEKMTRNLKVLWFLSTTTTMFSILVSLIYWSILYKPKGRSVIDLNNVLIHATNSIVLIVDLCVVKHPGRFGLFIYPLSCGFAYLLFSWFYPFLGGINKYGEGFIYPILNWNMNPMRASMAGVGIAISGATIHSLLTMAHKSRTHIHKSLVKTIDKQKTKEEIFFLTV